MIRSVTRTHDTSKNDSSLCIQPTSNDHIWIGSSLKWIRRRWSEHHWFRCVRVFLETTHVFTYHTYVIQCNTTVKLYFYCIASQACWFTIQTSYAINSNNFFIQLILILISINFSPQILEKIFVHNFLNFFKNIFYTIFIGRKAHRTQTVPLGAFPNTNTDKITVYNTCKAYGKTLFIMSRTIYNTIYKDYL